MSNWYQNQENISISSQYFHTQDEKFEASKNSTWNDIESEIGKNQTPVKAKIVNLQSKTKEK